MMAQSNAERYNVVVRIRIGFQIIELPTAQSLRPSVRTGAPPFTQGRHEALPRQCDKLQFIRIPAPMRKMKSPRENTRGIPYSPWARVTMSPTPSRITVG